jgi:polysaccharide export outer membrane protein
MESTTCFSIERFAYHVAKSYSAKVNFASSSAINVNNSGLAHMSKTSLISHSVTVIVALLLLLSPGYAPAQQEAGAAGPAAAATRGYEVQPGDLLQVSVWKEEGLDQEVLVRPDGGFSFPLAGDVSAVGKTVEDLRTEIMDRLARFIPGLVVTVAVKQINGNKVYVIGQVNKPGEFVVNPQVDVMQALSIAGGTTAFASTDSIFVLRRRTGRQVALPFKFSDVVRGRNLEQNILLESGDVVVVP